METVINSIVVVLLSVTLLLTQWELMSLKKKVRRIANSLLDLSVVTSKFAKTQQAINQTIIDEQFGKN